MGQRQSKGVTEAVEATLTWWLTRPPSVRSSGSDNAAHRWRTCADRAESDHARSLAGALYAVPRPGPQLRSIVGVSLAEDLL
jgi:hypothetical protein